MGVRPQPKHFAFSTFGHIVVTFSSHSTLLYAATCKPFADANVSESSRDESNLPTGALSGSLRAVLIHPMDSFEEEVDGRKLTEIINDTKVGYIVGSCATCTLISTHRSTKQSARICTRRYRNSSIILSLAFTLARLNVLSSTGWLVSTESMFSQALVGWSRQN